MYEFLHETVGNNMTQEVRSVNPKATVADLYRLFARHDYEAYPVVDDDKVVGIVSKLDALKPFILPQDQILPHYEGGMATTVDQIMSSSAVTVDPDTRLQRVLELMIEHRIKSLPVIDKWHGLVGIVAREDIMRAMARSVLKYPLALPFAEA